MAKAAEARLLNEEHRREPEKHRMKSSVWVTTFFTILAILACLLFSILFQRALSGFSRQVNAFVAVGDFSSVLLQAIVFIVSSAVILYLLFIYLASARVFSKAISFLGSPCMLFMSSFGSQGFLILWALMLCFVSSVSLVYFIFIGGIYSFCALLDQQCFDFRVLIPAIVSRFSNKKVDMVFCAEKKELLCSQANNQIWNFIAAFTCCVLTFAAILIMQNSVVYGLGKRQAEKERKTIERYEMRTLEK